MSRPAKNRDIHIGGLTPEARAHWFKCTLEQGDIQYWQRGPLKGQPKICKLCPEFVRAMPGTKQDGLRHPRLCPKHRRAHNAKYDQQRDQRRRERRAREVLGIDRTPAPSLFTLKPTPHKPSEPIFSHLPIATQTLAEQELSLLLSSAQAKGRTITTGYYAVLCASAANLAKKGGRKAWGKAMMQRRSLIARYRNMLQRGEL